MYRIICAALHSSNWVNNNAIMAYITDIGHRYKLERCVKELFYELKNTGECETLSKDRIVMVAKILINEGIERKLIMKEVG